MITTEARGRISVTVPIESYRTNPDDPSWDLPAWGHPLSQCVMPLFLTVADRLVPIGTAFTVGPISFLISAFHNVRESIKHEGRYVHLLGAAELPGSIAFKDVGLSVLHQRWKDESQTSLEITVWPVETFDGAPPSDLVLGFPTFREGFPTLGFPLSFALPSPGTTVWSIGYHTVRMPEGGIPLDRVGSGTFDWFNEYSHRFIVAEGHVENIFAPKFASGYLNAPCFSFTGEILHGQSGGPAMSTDGRVLGINAAGATSYFDKPSSLASLLYPALFTKLRSGVNFGPNFRFNASQPLLYWIESGGIRTDGSEETLGFVPVPGRAEPMVLPAISSEIAPSVFHDFESWQRGECVSSAPATTKVYSIRRKNNGLT